MKLQRLFTVLAALTVLATSAIAEAEVATALGRDGQLISLLSGTYGELFPDGTDAHADVAVLALQRTLAAGPRLVEVVPATLDQDLEAAAELVVEPVSGVTYVFWQSWTNRIHSRLLVSSFDGKDWHGPIEVSGSAFAWHTHPAFAVTRDSFADLGVEGAPAVTRTVLHVLWSEEGEAGHWDTKYAPLILENGEYVGEHPIVILNDLVRSDFPGPSRSIPVAPVLRARNGASSAVAAFYDQRSGQVAAVEVRFAAGELSILADAVAGAIEESSAQLPTSADAKVEAVVKAVRSRLWAYEKDVRPEILESLASELEHHLRGNWPEGDIARIRDDARAQVIDVGVRLTDGEVRRVTAVARAQVIDVGARNDGGPHRRHRHDARSSVTSSRLLPDISATPSVIVSSKGHKMMLVWSGEDQVRYRESVVDGGWGAVQQIQLSEQLNAAKAMEVLQKRIEQ